MDRRCFLACVAALAVMPKVILEPVFARGGVVRPGRAVLVGEHGFEIFINTKLDPKLAASEVVKALRQWQNRDV